MIMLCAFATGIISTAMELRGKKIKRGSNDDDPLAPSSSQSDDEVSDDVEVDTRQKRTRKEDVESSNTTNNKKSNADTGPHHCRFCGQEFKMSQALGGHMNRHRSEKQQEEMQKAESLVASKQQYFPGAPWTMQGGGGGNPYYGGNLLSNSPLVGTSSRPYFYPNQSASTLQNSQLNQVLAAQQNAQVAIHSLQGGGYYSPMDNTRTHHGIPSQRDVIPIGQYQAHQAPHVNSGQHPVKTVYSDPKSMLHSVTDTLQPHGNTFDLNQGGPSNLEDIVNTASNNQQGQSNIPMASSFIRQSTDSRQNNIQLVDQYGNLIRDNQPGHNFQMPQDYTQMPQDYTHMPSLDASQVFQGGTDQSTTLVESAQAGLEGSTDTSIDDHTSARLR